MSKGKQIAEKAMEKLGAVIKTYNEAVDTISNQKALQTLDYDSVLQKLDKAIDETEILEKVIKKNKIEIENLEPLIIALKNAMRAYHPIVLGLGKKADRTGKYGWLRYRKDLSAHDEAKKVLAKCGKAFWANVETVPEVTESLNTSKLTTDQLEKKVAEYEKQDNKTLSKYEVANSVTSFASDIAKRIWGDIEKYLAEIDPKLRPEDIIHLELALIAKEVYSFHVTLPHAQALELEALIFDMFPDGKEGYYGLEIQDYIQAIFTAIARKEKTFQGLQARLLHRLTDGEILEYMNQENFIECDQKIYSLLDSPVTTASSLETGSVIVGYSDKPEEAKQ